MAKQYVPLWESILDSPKVMKLPPDVFRFWTLALICAQRWDYVDGMLPDVERMSHWLRASEDECRVYLARLLDHGLIVSRGEGWAIHDWQDWRNVKDKTVANRVRKHREAKKQATETVVKRMSNVTSSVTCNGHVTTNPNPNPNPNNSRQAPRAHADGDAGAHAREGSPPACLPISAPPKDPDRWEPQPLPDESMTGRTGQDQADFVRAVRTLDAVESTRRLANELRMNCDTPGVRMLQGWQFVVGAFACQRPDKGKTWGALTAFARNAVEADFDKLNARHPPRASPAAALPPKTAEQMKAETDEANRELEAYRARMRANR